jgi:molybdate transport repressor ModE-like protein
VDVEPSVSLTVNGMHITPRQLEALREVWRVGSQKAAAEALGISVPVLHRHISSMEERVGIKLLDSSPQGTRLTTDGEELVREFNALQSRVSARESTIVGCTLVTEELLLAALSGLGEGFDLIISDDERNLKDFEAGLMDIVVVDDPLYLYDLEGVQFEQVAEDELVHVRRGDRYMRYRYGAQRIGFRQLDADGEEYTLVGDTRSMSMLVDSPYSFFINESLLSRKGIRLRSHTPTEKLHHTINAVYRSETPRIAALLRELRADRI